MSLHFELVPLSNPIEVGYGTTPLIPWTPSGFRRVVRIACINNGPVPVTFILYTSDCSGDLPDDPDSLVVPPGEQRSFKILDALDVYFLLEAHTNTPDTTSQVRCVVKGTWLSP